MTKTVNPIWQQQDYAFYEDDGTESASTLIGSAGASQSLDVDTIYFCRLAIAETAGATESPALNVEWQYNLAGGGWVAMSTTVGAVRFANSSNIATLDITTNRDPTGTGTFNAGRCYEEQNTGTTAYTSSGSDHTELLAVFTIVSSLVSNGQTIEIRCVEGNGTVFDGTYTNATATVVEAAGAFQVAWANRGNQLL